MRFLFTIAMLCSKGVPEDGSSLPTVPDEETTQPPTDPTSPEGLLECMSTDSVCLVSVIVLW